MGCITKWGHTVSYCDKCGTAMQQSAGFCPNCGRAVELPAPTGSAHARYIYRAIPWIRVHAEPPEKTMAMASLILGVIPIAVFVMAIFAVSMGGGGSLPIDASAPPAAAPDVTTAGSPNAASTVSSTFGGCAMCIGLIVNGLVGLVLGRESKARLSEAGEPTGLAAAGVVCNAIDMAIWALILAAIIFI